MGSRSAAAVAAMDLYCAPVDLVDAANESHNDQAVSSCRVVVSAAAGCVAGLLGLRGIAGLAFFIAMSLVTSAAIALRVQGRVGRYFRSPWHVVKPGLFQGATVTLKPIQAMLADRCAICADVRPVLDAYIQLHIHILTGSASYPALRSRSALCMSQETPPLQHMFREPSHFSARRLACQCDERSRLVLVALPAVGTRSLARCMICRIFIQKWFLGKRSC